MINNLRYADDKVILAETEHELRHLMDIVVPESEHKGLFLNIAKCFKCSAGHHPYLHARLMFTVNPWSR